MSYVPSGERKRNPDKSEYEAMANEGDFYFVGHTLKTALKRAGELAGDLGRDVRLYHTHRSPGPVRRFCGKVDMVGVFHDARR